MAGIGFELRKLLRTQTYAGLLRAYGYAGLISSGPWVLSILVVMLLGVASLPRVHAPHDIDAFLVSVTYLVAVSLILTGAVQLLYTRFVADRLYEDRREVVLPNLISLLGAVTTGSAVLALVILFTLFNGTSRLYQLEMFSGFVLLSNIWILTIFLSGMKTYRAILGCFAAGYGVVLVLGLLVRGIGLEGLLGAFDLGQAVLFFLMLYLVLREYPGERMIAWDLTNKELIYRKLIFIGVFYNLGIWIDKFLFWFNPLTSVPVIGPLRASPLYDFPLFLAYLSIVPGMAVFLVRMETDFAERYDAYYDAIRGGDTFGHIEDLRNSMIDTARQGIFEIFKIQGITIAVLLLLASTLMGALGFSQLYVPLFNIDIVSVGIQVLLLAVLNTLFYLDKLVIALRLCALFVVSNFLFTLASQWLGAAFYGYGYALSLALTSIVGLIELSREFDRLTYQTFMYQPGPASAVLVDKVKGAPRDRQSLLDRLKGS